MFWFIVGSISTFFAEVISGSTAFPFFTPEGWLIVFPVYEFHIFVLGSVVIKNGKPTLYSLYTAGVIFGMYETYITKVIWGSADWTHAPVIFGIYLIPFFLVALFWHPFMSFIIPLTFSEITLSSSKSILNYMPQWLSRYFQQDRQRKTLIIGAIVLGLLGMFNLSPLMVFLSATLNVMFMAILILLWRRFTSGCSYPLKAFMPGKLGFFTGLGALIVIYTVFGATFNPQFIPPFPVHIFTILIYAILFILLWRNIILSRTATPQIFPKIEINRKFLFLLIALFVSTTTLESLFPLKLFIFTGFLVIESMVGVCFLICVILKGLRADIKIIRLCG